MSRFHQTSLLDLPSREVELNSTVAPADRVRLSRQHHQLLERLREGPATNGDMLAMGIQRFGARLHELQKAGCVIAKESLGKGLWQYTMSYCPAELTAGD